MIRGQGLYYVLGGSWGLLHLRSFAAVAGPKPDVFQTQVTAALFCAIGTTLLRPDRAQPWARQLALASALGCAAVDLRHLPRLRPVFLADIALNSMFAVRAMAPGRCTTFVRSAGGRLPAVARTRRRAGSSKAI